MQIDRQVQVQGQKASSSSLKHEGCLQCFSSDSDWVMAKMKRESNNRNNKYLQDIHTSQLKKGAFFIDFNPLTRREDHKIVPVRHKLIVFVWALFKSILSTKTH